jgi:hypothetical protein
MRKKAPPKTKALEPPVVMLEKKQVVQGKDGFTVVQVVLNMNLTMMHDGLSKFCRENGLEIKDLAEGNCVLFVNRAGKYIKLLVGTESRYPVVAAYHMPKGTRFSLQAVADIARAFRSRTKVDASLVLRQSMQNYYLRTKKARKAA